MSRLLTLQDGKGGFEFAGNAFQIDPAPSNIARLTCFHPSDIISILRSIFLKVFLSQNTPLTGLLEEGADLKRNFFHLVGIFSKEK